MDQETVVLLSVNTEQLSQRDTLRLVNVFFYYFFNKLLKIVDDFRRKRRSLSVGDIHSWAPESFTL